MPARGSSSAATPTGSSFGDDGRTTGVEATVTHADGSSTELTVQAPTVVVACGAIESPALLLRSGIGGPAVGKHLRLHPAGIVNGIYDEPIEAWVGQIQSEVSDHFARLRGRPRLPDRVRRRDARGACRRDPVARRRAAQARVRTDVPPPRSVPVGRARSRRGRGRARPPWPAGRPLVAERRRRPAPVRPRQRRARPAAPRRRGARDPHAAREELCWRPTRASRSRPS